MNNFTNFARLFINLNEQIKEKKINLDEENEKIYNALSILYGASLGDSMGSYCEFTNPNPENYKRIWSEINPIFRTGRGQVTDDTEMAMSMAYGILEGVNKKINNLDSAILNPDPVAYYYSFWLLSEPFDIGNTTHNALNVNNSQSYLNKDINNCGLAKKFHENSINKNSESLSNGFLMRRTPYTVFIYYFFELNKDQPFYFKTLLEAKKYEELFFFLHDITEQEVALTHWNIECKIAAIIYDFIILCCLYYFDKENSDTSAILYKISDFFEGLTKAKNKNVSGGIVKFFDLFKEINEISSFEIAKEKEMFTEIGKKCIGFYRHAFKIIFLVLRFYQDFSKNGKENIYEDIMFFICNLGGDTDTNCCIAGGVVGALVKLGNINEKYLNPHLEFCTSSAKTKQPRWIIYSPAYLGYYAIKLYDNMENPKDRKE